MKILIVTNKEDTHPNSVINLLRKGEIPFFRLNTEALMIDYDFAWGYAPGSGPDLYIKDRNNGNVIWGHEIHSVWIRRPKDPESLLFSVNEEVDKHNLEECKQFYLYLMYYLSDFYSIGSHLYNKRANSKIVQLETALKLGMRVPYSCITNTQRDIEEFCKPFDELILKPLGNFNVLQGNETVYHLFATKIDASRIPECPQEAFSQTVSFCEEYVDKKYELRITVMASHIFPCKLDSQSLQDNTGKIDWRQGYEHNLKHEMVTVPPFVEDFCRNYLRQMNIKFGCFDFIVTPDDEYVFLECNPNGQWGWIEDELNISSMSEAMVDCLVNRREV